MNNEDFIMKLLCEMHEGLERQGPGSTEMTIKALSFLEGLNENSKIADMGCGTGGQTAVLAKKIGGKITGVDLFPAFIDRFNENMKKLNLEKNVNGVVGSMADLNFEKEAFDLIWSEGAIDNIGFEKGLSYWHQFLKKDGYVVVTCPTWLTNNRPEKIENFWSEAGSELDTTGNNINIIQKIGYLPVASFVLPENCWIDHYFSSREKAGKMLLEKYPGNKTVEAFVDQMLKEVELYLNYKEFYGYVFYIAKKR